MNKPNAGATEKPKMVSLNKFRQFTEVGDTLAGKLVGSRPIVINGTSTHQFLIVNEEGLWTINSTAQLDILQFLPVGTSVELEFLGTIKGTQNVKAFDVRVPEQTLSHVMENMVSPTEAERPALSAPEIDPFAITE